MPRGEILAITLVIATALSIVANWLPRPAKLGVRSTAVLLVILMVGSVAWSMNEDDQGGNTPSAARPPASPSPPLTQSPPAAAPSGTPSPDSPSQATEAVSTPRSAQTPGPAPQASHPAQASDTPSPARTVDSSPYVQAPQVVPFGSTGGSAKFQSSGSAITIGSLPQNDHQWGMEIPGANRCNTTVTFDAWLEPGTTQSYGFGISARGAVSGDQASGPAMMFYRDTDGQFIALNSALPSPGIGGVGGGSYPVADLTKARHIIVNDQLDSLTVTVDGQQTGTYSPANNCGIPLFYSWGGATVHLDHIVIS